MKPGDGRPGLRLEPGHDDTRPVLITGGAGFIGSNIAHRLLSDGHPVLLFDNLSRPGAEQNLRWLRERHGRLLRVEVADVRDRAAVQRAVAAARQVVHLAAQVAVTTSLADPLLDFGVNALGTLHLLDALRSQPNPPPLLFTSTNKVYGCLADVRLEMDGRRYRPSDERLHGHGIDETRPLDFYSPYGCSKGTADQYVLDHARTFGLRAAVFRMSCIYGPRQFGTEDQGWVAHFLIRALQGEPITLYGDGLQVRDVLFIDDLVDAVLIALRHMDGVTGQAFNIGGGPHNTTSLVELIDLISELSATHPSVRFHEWRPGDQRYYVSDTARFSALTGWRPGTSVADGVRRLYDWLIAEGVTARAPAVNSAVEWQGPAQPSAAVASDR
jgi:CDP-paratose 2-epimerase